jgi:hypothetical protein
VFHLALMIWGSNTKGKRSSIAASLTLDG